MSLLRQSVLAASSAIMLTVSRFAFTAILARRLSTDGFGRFTYAQWMVDIAFLVCALGVTGAASRYMAEFRHDEKSLQSFMGSWRPWAIGLPFLAGGAVLVGAFLSSYELDSLSKLLLALWATTNGIMAMEIAALAGLQRFDLIFCSNLIVASVMVAGALLLQVDSDSQAALYAIMAVACGVGSVPGLMACYKYKAEKSSVINLEKWRSIRSYAMNMWLVALLWSLVWSRGELPIVKSMLGDRGVASYVTALTLFGGAIQGVMLGVSAVAPQLTRLWGEGRKVDALTTARNVMDLQLLVCGAASSVLIYLGPEILSLFFGHGYGAQALTLKILSVGLVSMALANQNHLLQIASDGRYSRNVTAVGLFVLMFSSVVLVPLLSVVGAGLARAGTMILMSVVSIEMVRRRFGKDYISIGNVYFVYLLLIIDLILCQILANIGFVSRVVMLVLSIVVLVYIVRDRAGQLQAKYLMRNLKRFSL